jgi:hypothetical protein
MAQRFGGRYSPQGTPVQPGSPPPAGGRAGPPPPEWHRRGPARLAARANVLFLFPLPFAVSAFLGDPTNLAVKLAAVAMLLLAAWLTREGLRAEAAYDARKVARRPAIPRKIFASVATGIGLGLGGWTAGTGFGVPILFALLGGGLHFAAFGPDPLRDKGLEGMDAHQTDRVARAVDEAERHLSDMTETIRKLGDRRLADRMAAFQRNVREMFAAVENNPQNLTAARRYLGVYLLGARDATTKFADLYGRDRAAAALTDYTALLDDLDRNFAARTEALRAGDRTALDIEVEVLRERLAREGVRTED